MFYTACEKCGERWLIGEASSCTCPAEGGKNVLSCGCRSEYLGFPAVWDSQADDGSPATAHGSICERHFYEWQARPEGGA